MSQVSSWALRSRGSASLALINRTASPQSTWTTTTSRPAYVVPMRTKRSSSSGGASDRALRSPQYGSTRIGYRIRRSARRKTVSIAVLPADGVLLTAPAGTAIPKLDQLVHQKARWIVERLRAKRELVETKIQREFVSGESFSYLGRQYRLRVIRDAEPKPLSLKAGWLRVHVPVGLAARHHAGYVKAALIDWYRTQRPSPHPAARRRVGEQARPTRA